MADDGKIVITIKLKIGTNWRMVIFPTSLEFQYGEGEDGRVEEEFPVFRRLVIQRVKEKREDLVVTWKGKKGKEATTQTNCIFRRGRRLHSDS